MKPTAGLSLTFSLLMAIMVSPLQAQDETDDLYINSKDIKKKKEEAKKEQVNPERTYYSYPQPGNGQAGSASGNQEQDKFSQPGYTNKYIEAEKNEGITNASPPSTSQPANQNYNNQDTQSENVKWYKNNKRNLRRKAYGSQYTIAPAVGYNSYNGWNTGVSFGWNSGWNNWYGWNSPYYNGWNNYGYGGYGGGYGMNYGYGGYGFNNPYSFGNYYYSPGWFVGYNSYSGRGSGFGYGYGYGYGGYYNPYSWGAWGNPYYGWRPVVYVPVNTYSNTNSGVRAVNYGPINDRSSPSGRNNYSQNGNVYTNPSRNEGNSNIGSTRGGGSVAPSGNNNSRGGGNQYNNSVPSRDGYSNPQSPSTSNSTQQAPNQRSGNGGNRNYTVPARDRSNDVFSRPSNSWGGNQGNSGFGGGQRGGGDFGGNSGGSNRMGGGNSGGGGSNFGGGGGGRVPGGR